MRAGRLRTGAWALLLALAAGWARGAEVVFETDVAVRMRDGLALSTDLARPAGEGKHSTVLMRTPYDKGENIRHLEAFPRNGCAAVVQDVRGRYKSEGTFYPFLNERNDGYDTIAWIAEQPWSDGRVVMMGGSYGAVVQLQAAVAGSEHLAGMQAVVPSSGRVEGLLFQGGELRQELIQGWMLSVARNSKRMLAGEAPSDEVERWRTETGERLFRRLPLRDAGPLRLGGESYVSAWEDVIASWEDPPKWKVADAIAQAERIRAPVMLVGGWYDIFVQENIDLWRALRETRRGKDGAGVHLLIGPWTHGIGGPAGDKDYPDARAKLGVWQGAWQRYVLLKEPMAGLPALAFYVMNSERWITAETWPPERSTVLAMYLAREGEEGRLAAEGPGGEGGSSAFVSDPEDPVPTLGGNNLTIVSGIRDHRALGERSDVLVFKTGPLDEDRTIAGEVRARLFVSTDGPDTSFAALLADWDEEGYAANVCDGIARVRYRNGREAELVTPGEVVEVSIDLWSTAYTFKKGHRIALLVAGSNFPRFSRNLNTAAFPGEATTGRKAQNTVYHEAGRASCVELPFYELP